MQHFTAQNSSQNSSDTAACRSARRPMAAMPRLLTTTGLLFSLAVVTSGCTGGSQPSASTPAPTGAEAPPAEDAQPAATAAAPAKPRERNEVWTDEKGQKWFGNVPMDAFFDQPYEVASNATAIGGPNGAAPAAAMGEQTTAQQPAEAVAATTPATEPATPAQPSPDTPAPAAAEGGDSWDQLLPLADLDEEIKSIRNFLQETVSSVGNYNSSMMMIPPKVATLAALAEVARQRQESVSWKEDAAWVRDLAKKMNESPLQRGPKDQKRLQELFEGVSDIFNRSKPAGLEEPPAEDSFAESAELRSLMKRMEEAEKTLKTEIGSADALASKKTMAQHEAAILAVLAKIATDKGYGYDDDEFRGYGNAVVEAAQAIRTSTEGGDFSGFEAAMSKVATSCQNCHSKYKND